jgi:DNA (cytosine-5)-methyltransferase 1
MADQVHRLAYYSEHDPFAAAWLRELIHAGHIAPGVVDERSVTDVTASDLAGFTQCHFFAGIGVWSYALRRAGWADRAPVWTGSCPCQPFSHAGQRGGADDPRHLWPAWFRLLRECRPDVVFGEQVASQAGLAWLDVVSADLEGAGYAVGAADLCAAGVGAPHIRQRLYFVADARGDGAGQHARELPRHEGEYAFGRQDGHHAPVAGGATRHLGDAGGAGLPARERTTVCGARWGDEGGAARESGGAPLAGFWADAEWIACSDGKARPVEPGTFPLVDGAPARVGRLRGYGNALCAETAIAFIEAYRDVAAGAAGAV